MFLDGRRVPADTVISADVCIVGAGAAGIALACELQNRPVKVVLLESGGTRFDRNTQDLYRGEVADRNAHRPLHVWRQRQFGGTTNLWGGWCAPFDQLDFEHLPYVAHSGWPIGKSDLDPYYARANRYCEVGDYSYSVGESLPGRPPSIIPGLESEDVSVEGLYRFSPPTKFGNAYRRQLKQAPNVHVYLRANCLKIVTTPQGNLVHHVKAASLAKNYFQVQAKYYVLAAGALETTRLLLVSNDIHRKGIGNACGLLGRFYMSHLTGDIAEVYLRCNPQMVIWDYEKSLDGVYTRRNVSITPVARQRDELLNCRLFLWHEKTSNPKHQNGILSAKYLARRFLVPRIRDYRGETLGSLGGGRLRKHLRNIIADLPSCLTFSRMWLKHRVLSRRKLPSLILQSSTNVYRLHFYAEQRPEFCNFVGLNGQSDWFGINRLSVHWRCSNADAESVIQIHRLLGQALERSGAGRLVMTPEEVARFRKDKCKVGSHHMGTTRMAADPSEGVVDENCRVHGVENLYVASASVFPTGSYANPTLTIVALAIRVSDHLKQLHDRGE